MKTHTTKHIVLSLLLTATVTFSGTAQAQMFGSFSLKGLIDSAGSKLDELNKKREEALEAQEKAPINGVSFSTKKTSTSMVEVKGNLDPKMKWVMISIGKGSYSDVLYTTVNNGQFSYRITFQDGAGTYNINILQSSHEKMGIGNFFSGLVNVDIQNTDTRDNKFLLPSEMVQSDDEEIVNLTKDITANSNNEVEAMKAIHDYVKDNIKYDWASYKDNTFQDKIYSALNTKRDLLGVCSGYSALTAAMARAYGIRAKVIDGKALVDGEWAQHAWNEVLINGEWKIVDTTWDSTMNSDKYFFINAQEFSKTHKKEKVLLHQ